MTHSSVDLVVRAFVDRSDIADLALFIWASIMTALLIWTMRELAQANRRFDAFVRELGRFNERFAPKDDPPSAV